MAQAGPELHFASQTIAWRGDAGGTAGEVSSVDVSVIIVSHGHERFLGKCLASLEKGLIGLGAEAVLVDNLGTNGFMAAAGDPIFPIRIQINDRRQSLARNTNQAVGAASGRYVLLLNPDTMFLQGSLREAINFMEEEPRVGLVGCKLLNPDGTVQRNYRRFPIVPVVVARGLGADGWARRPALYRWYMMEGQLFDAPTEVDWVYGAFALLRREVFLEIGGFDERFHLYYEDVDLCYRLRSRGLKTFYFPGIELLHHHARASAVRPLGQKWRWHVCSAWQYFLKHRYAFRPTLNGAGGPQRP
jgi:GT2 family glycosyltransferase